MLLLGVGARLAALSVSFGTSPTWRDPRWRWVAGTSFSGVFLPGAREPAGCLLDTADPEEWYARHGSQRSSEVRLDSHAPSGDGQLLAGHVGEILHPDPYWKNGEFLSYFMFSITPAGLARGCFNMEASWSWEPMPSSSPRRRSPPCCGSERPAGGGAHGDRPARGDLRLCL